MQSMPGPEKPAAGFGSDGRVDLREGLGRDPETLSLGLDTPGVVYKNLLHCRRANGRNAGLASRRHSGLRRANWKDPLDVSHHSASRRVWV